MITGKILIKEQGLKQRVSITVKTLTYKITGIKTNYIHVSGIKSYIGITPIVDMSYTPDPAEINYTKYNIVINATLTDDISIILNSHNNVKNLVEDYTYELENVDNTNTLFVNIDIQNTEIHHSHNIKQTDDVLRYYRKLFPIYNLKAYQVQGNQVAHSGAIDRITWDIELKKFRVYMSDGLSLLYDNYPLAFEEEMVIQNREHVTPPNMYWLVDDSYRDLIFVDQLKIFESKIILGNEKWDDPIDLIYKLTKINENTTRSDRFIILQAVFEIQALNQIIKIDFTNKYYKLRDFLPEIGPGSIRMFAIPFRKLYSKLSSYNTIKITMNIFDVDRYLESHSEEDLENYVLNHNTVLEMTGEIKSYNPIPHSRKDDDEEYYRIQAPDA